MRALASLLNLGKYGHRRVFGWEHGETIPTTLYAQALADTLGFASGEQVRQICTVWQVQKMPIGDKKKEELLQ